jgi:arylsulfatase A-like enzyme
MELIPTFKKDPQTLSNLIALYDSEINFVDSYIGELIQKFDLDKNTLIIITSDHGEEFLEHGMLDHGYNLYAESINIPLIIKYPQQTTKKVVNQQVSLIDIMPTILSLLNIPHPEQTIGEPLITPNGKTANIADRFLFTELERGNRNMKAILTKEWKYIFNYKAKKEEFPKRLKRAWNENWKYIFSYKEVIEGLYNRKRDLQEQVNLIRVESSLGKQLNEQLNKWVTTTPRYPANRIEITPSQETEEQLKALGYISNGNEEKLKPPPKCCTNCKSIPYKNQQ